jgi:hypothetical protein
MPQQWGLDSGDAMSRSYGGTNLANYAINTWFAGAPRDSVVWWGRYFQTDIVTAYTSNQEALDLLAAIQANPTTRHYYGWILPLSDPSTSKVETGSTAVGMSYGNSVCQNINHWITNGSNTHPPASNECWVFLDIDNTVGATFWQGWWTAVYTFVAGVGYTPCAYTHPYSEQCGVITSASHPAAGVWSNELEPSCGSPGPTWNPAICAGHSSSLIVAWQYGESCMHGYVDVDSANVGFSGPTGNGLMDYIIYAA